MTRLLGNTVLLQPVAELPSSTGGILLPNFSMMVADVVLTRKSANAELSDRRENNP
jgi:hypothetical protein